MNGSAKTISITGGSHETPISYTRHSHLPARLYGRLWAATPDIRTSKRTSYGKLPDQHGGFRRYPLWRNAVDPTGGKHRSPAGKISAEDALAIALDNAGVPEDDAYNIKNEKDSDNGIPLYDIEFETDYGDYDFEVAIADGRIVGGTTRWMRNGWTLWEVALSPWRRPQSLLLAKSPALMRQTYLFGRSLKMAGTATRGSCFLKI